MQKRPPMGGSRGSDHGGDAATGCRIGPASVTPSDQTAQVSRVKANSARRSTWKPVVGLEAARRHYLDQCADPGVNLDEEQRIIFDALREIAGKRPMQAQADDDLGNIPAGFDRRARP